MQTSDFDYELPADLIAQSPKERRDASRLMVVDRRSNEILHRQFHEIGEFLRAGDRLVVNDAKVVPARVLGRREKTGGRWEGLFLRALGDEWELLCKTRGRPAVGERIALDPANESAKGWSLTLVAKMGAGVWRARPNAPGGVWELLERVGHTPLPPYIRKGRDRPEDRERYQTVYADRPGAIAAPTAGLHFTVDLLDRLQSAGVGVERVTLAVGAGTFLPVATEKVSEHRMHSEWCEMTESAAGRLNAVRMAGGRVVAVGTTVVRTLESAWKTTPAGGELSAIAGETEIFITPGRPIRAVDALVTNFHLPRSTLLMLVSALAGVELIRRAYAVAIQERYRFYSYGDAMLII